MNNTEHGDDKTTEVFSWLRKLERHQLLVTLIPQSTLTGHSLISPVTKEINQQIHKYHMNKCRVNYWTMTMKILSENLQCCTRTKWTFFPSPLAKHKHSLRIQNIIRIRINLDSNPDVCRTAPKILRIH